MARVSHAASISVAQASKAIVWMFSKGSKERDDMELDELSDDNELITGDDKDMKDEAGDPVDVDEDAAGEPHVMDRIGYDATVFILLELSAGHH